MNIKSLHIHAPPGYYIGQVRASGARRWTTATGQCKTPEAALAKAALKMRGMKRARVIFVDHAGWYEPSVVMEASR